MEIPVEKIRKLAKNQGTEEIISFGHPYFAGRDPRYDVEDLDWSIEIIYFDTRIGVLRKVNRPEAEIVFSGLRYSQYYIWTLDSCIIFEGNENRIGIPKVIIHPILNEILIIIKFTYDKYLPSLKVTNSAEALDEIPF